MKLAIIGSRTLKQLDISKYIHAKPEIVISGGAIGIDTIAEQWAKANNIETIIIRPNYARYGKGAPLRRNEEIINIADIVLAFWDGESKGTKHAIDFARKINKEVIIEKII